jgi:hypothetical protein
MYLSVVRKEDGGDILAVLGCRTDVSSAYAFVEERWNACRTELDCLWAAAGLLYFHSSVTQPQYIILNSVSESKIGEYTGGDGAGPAEGRPVF